MLEQLIVNNLGLIESATIEPGPGLIVITGETGTGKTLLLGALDLLVGGQGRRDLIGPHGDTTVVQARFLPDGDSSDEVIVVRQISRKGKSRAYVDGLMAPVKQLAAATNGYVEIVGQHEHLLLRRSAHVRRIVDTSGGAKVDAARAAYVAAWERLGSLEKQIETLGGDRRALEREQGVQRLQADEISEAALVPDEDESLATSVVRLRNSTAILESLDVVMQRLGEEGIEETFDSVVVAAERVVMLDPSQRSLVEQTLDIANLLGELRTDVARIASEIGADPDELDIAEARIAQINDLKRKYGATIEEVLDFGQKANERAAELERLLATSDEIAVEVETTRAELLRCAETLRDARRSAARDLATKVVGHLQDLGFDDPIVDFVFDEVEPHADGADRITMVFSSAAELEPQPVARIASGGELSRLVLAITLAVGGDTAAVAVFDEIDAGVGGSVALALGEKLATLATKRQVLCVTHLPQIAAFADTHVKVTRAGSTTTVRTVDANQRVEELSRMLAGLPDSQRGREHAAELIAAAGTVRQGR